MDGKIVEQKAMRLLGTTARINPMSADYTKLWGEFDKRSAEVEALAIEKGYYSAYSGTDEPPMADYLAGMVVAADAQAPEGLATLDVAAGRYAQFECTLGTIDPTWGGIYETWLPQSQWAEDESRPSLEYYAPDMSHGPEGKLTILVPVKAKE